MHPEQPTHPLDVLLVEDDPGDVLIAREALSAAKVDTELTVVNDGAAAIDYLRHRGEYTKAARPDLILLDLNLPRRSGHEVLEEIKNDPDLRQIPVVVLSTSISIDDIRKSYDLHANVYVAKPVDFDDFAGVVRQIDGFFGSVAQLPPR